MRTPRRNQSRRTATTAVGRSAGRGVVLSLIGIHGGGIVVLLGDSQALSVAGTVSFGSISQIL